MGKTLLLLILALLILLAGRWAGAWKTKDYTIATGKPGAGYGEFASGLVEIGKKKQGTLKLRALESEGSIQNMLMLEEGRADFGLVQQGVPFANNVRAVASIYSDTIHILVRNDAQIQSIADFRHRKTSLGLKASGTRVIAMDLLKHYAVGEDEITDHILEPRAAALALIAGEIDVMIMVTAMRAPIIGEALATGEISHLSLGDPDDPHGIAQGISSRYPYLKPSTIPQHAYGIGQQGKTALPQQAVSVLAIPSLLVCRDDIPNAAVTAITRSIFANRHTLAQRLPAAIDIHEPKDIHDLGCPIHEGAEEYYRRKDPGFLVIYAEVIALLLSGIIAAVGLITGMRRWIQHRQKNRIDVYYKAINTCLKGLEDGTITNFQQEQNNLIELKHNAFEELINERLTADESFRIFQDLLEQCLLELKQKAEEVNTVSQDPV